MLDYTIKRMTRQYISTLKANMAKEKQTLSLDLKRINETRNYLIEEIINDLMNKKHKNACRNLNYFKHFLFFISAVSGCVSISWSSCGYYKFCSRIKTLCNNCRN